MTVALTSEKGLSARGIPASTFMPFSPKSSTYTRPTDWLALPTLLETDQKFVGLYAVYDNTSNFIALSATVFGGYQVDWGDGTAPQTYDTRTTAEYNYNFSDISSSTLTTSGYRQAIVTVTPVVSANPMSIVDLNKKYTNNPVLPKYATKWLDIAVAGPNLTTFTISGPSSVVSHKLLEQVSIIKTASNSSGFFNYMFLDLNNLRSVPVLAGPANWSGANGMFQNCWKLINLPSLPPTSLIIGAGTMFNFCYSLEKFPDFPNQVDSVTNMFQFCHSMITAPNVTIRNVGQISSMFNSCVKLVDASRIKILNLGTSTGVSSMFANCYSLIEAPYLDFTNVTSVSSMFSGCYNLKVVPNYDTSKVTDFSSMFRFCNSLENAPNLDTAKALNTSNMFGGCTALLNVPLYDLNKVTNSSNMFNGCNSIKAIPAFNLQNSTTGQGMFSNCQSLEKVEDLITTKMINVDGMFQNCYAIRILPNMDTANVTNFNNFVNGCLVLTEVPLYNTANGITFNSTFLSTQSLSTIPELNLIKAVDIQQMFRNSRIVSVPNLNTSNVTFFAGMFDNCQVLNSVAGLNTEKATSISTMFSSCNALIEIPTMNFANVLSSPGNFTQNSLGLAKVGIAGLRFTHGYFGTLLNKAALETVCINLGTAATTQTLTITNNPGADPAVTKTAVTITLKSCDLSDTIGLEAGMYVYSDGVAPITINFSSETNEFTFSNSFNPVNGTMVSFTAFGTNPGLAINTIYYTTALRSGEFFKLALTPGGDPITLTATSTGTMNYENYITSVSTNNVLLALPGNSGSGRTLVSRKLNTHAARLKNWTVTG